MKRVVVGTGSVLAGKWVFIVTNVLLCSIEIMGLLVTNGLIKPEHVPYIAVLQGTLNIILRYFFLDDKKNASVAS